MALEEILHHVRADVQERRRHTPLERITSELHPTDRSLETALRHPRTGFILECKRASPSAGPLRPDLAPETVVEAYSPHADAISVVTEPHFFGGSHDDLRRIRERVRQPVLCKDFIVDPYQIYEARRAGADAVLLMLSVLSDFDYRECRAAAKSLGMDVLTEVHSAQELARAQALDARIIGINNRDLATLTVDLAVTERLAPRAATAPAVVAESGIASHGDVLRLRPLVDGFLVGSALMRTPDLAAATRALVYGVTKICGLTRPEDAVTAHALGATHGGLIFAEGSPRQVTSYAARGIRSAAALQWVGVFVNTPVDEVVAMADDLDLAAVQLHGEETPAIVTELRERFAGRREVWKAIRVRENVPRVVDTGADRVLLDAYAEGVRGGTGRRFNWAVLRDHPDLGRMLLGGGLTPDAVYAAEAAGTWGLDVNSGVERAPGQKDPVKVATFLDRRRGHGRERRGTQ